jgi:hypothetical protein
MAVPVPVFVGVVTDEYRLVLDDRAAFLRYLRQFQGDEVALTVKKHRHSRSLQANAYYFGVVVKLLSEWSGYELDEMHECLAMRFLRIEDDPITGAPRRKRTPKCNSAEFAEFVDQCIRFAAEQGVVIPEPHHVDDAA